MSLNFWEAIVAIQDDWEIFSEHMGAKMPPCLINVMLIFLTITHIY